MPPSEHETREPRLYSAASADDTDALQEVTNCPWDWHGDELVSAAGYAARHGALDALRWLLAHGVHATDTTARNFNREISADVGSEPLMVFAAQGGSIDAAELLLSRGAAASASDGTGRTPLHAAAAHGHLPMLRWLIAHGADVNALAFEGTPLAGAVSCNRPEIVRELLAAGADPARKHDWCSSALEAARAHPALLALLTAARA
jgi:ankyrin repeat protein